MNRRRITAPNLLLAVVAKREYESGYQQGYRLARRFRSTLIGRVAARYLRHRRTTSP